jgi:hypothetical protein
MSQNTAVVIGLVILVLAFVLGIVRRDRLPGSTALRTALLVVIAAAAALLVALLVS